jgi:glycosyltransferase involved in cell wall biosynthesis
MEWVIIDDGTDKIGDLVSAIPEVKYFAYEKKMTLGEKRNLMHEKSKGSILVYMDDDDYYPPERVSHAVTMLKENPAAMCAGSSEMYIYFKGIKKMYKFGPYGPNHSTAATFAFRRELLKDHCYENNASLAEEKAFLKNYTVPFVQLNPLKTILVFSHEHNTFDKRKLLENPHPQFVNESSKTVNMFIKDPDIIDFYLNRLEGYLKKYAPGRPEMKPDVLLQTRQLKEERQLEENKRRNNHGNGANGNDGGQITFQQGDGPPQILTMQQIVELLQHQKNMIDQLLNQLKGKDDEIQLLTDELKKYSSSSV